MTFFGKVLFYHELRSWMNYEIGMRKHDNYYFFQYPKRPKSCCYRLTAFSMLSTLRRESFLQEWIWYSFPAARWLKKMVLCWISIELWSSRFKKFLKFGEAAHAILYHFDIETYFIKDEKSYHSLLMLAVN